MTRYYVWAYDDDGCPVYYRHLRDNHHTWDSALTTDTTLFDDRYTAAGLANWLTKARHRWVAPTARVSEAPAMIPLACPGCRAPYTPGVACEQCAEDDELLAYWARTEGPQ